MNTTLRCGLLLGLCCLTGILSAGESGDIDRERPLVKQGVLGTVNVLRELDVKTWTNRVKATSNVDDTAINTVTFGALWDDTYLYVGVKVLDANLQKTCEAAYMNDSVEVYVDPTHNKATAYDSQDRQFVKGWNDERILGMNTTGVLHGWAAITGGYTVELAIPWSNLGVTPSAKMTIGFDIGNNSDGPCGRNTPLMWHGTDQNWQDTSAFGDLVLSAQTAGGDNGAASPDAKAPADRPTGPPPATAVTAKRTLSKLTIDGKLDEAVWSLPTTACKLLSGTGTAAETIDGSGKALEPKQDGSTPLVLTYSLPGPRTVSSLVIAYVDYTGSDTPATVRLEGSADGGRTWRKVCESRPSKTGYFTKCFKPVTVNQLRLTQEGGGLHRTKEVFIYADPEAAPLPLFGSKDSGACSFLRGLWYAGKITESVSPATRVWVRPYGSPPHDPFRSAMGHQHDYGWGQGEPYGVPQPGKRIYLRLDLDTAYPMNFGVISGVLAETAIGRHSKAEFYTARGKLDPSALAGNGIADLTGQGWVLQKAWDKDSDLGKSFRLAHPGLYNQMLVVWDCDNRTSWMHLEMFGVETPPKADRPAKSKPEGGSTE